MHDEFHYADGALRCEGVAAETLADAVKTPVYVYSRGSFARRFDAIREAFAPLDPLICYSVKANGNLSVLRLLKERGAGFDVVSGGELFRTMKVDADPSKIVFAGVGKTDDELRYGLRKRIFLFDVESEGELVRLGALAHEMGLCARVAIRVNPDVDPKTHRYISTGKRESKFGIDLESAHGLLHRAKALPGIELAGLHMHIGSQLTDLAPHREALARLLAFYDRLKAEGIALTLLNLGGGFGIDYTGEGKALPIGEFAAVMVPPLLERGLKLVLEPGRFIAGPSGILLTRVVYVKESGERRFVITDAAMTDLIRPALYGSYHAIWPVKAAGGPGEPNAPAIAGEADIVGPVCESGDFLAKERPFPKVAPGDLLAVFCAGAYGFVMASQYNARPRPAEVLVDGAEWKVVRRRETLEDLVAHEA